MLSQISWADYISTIIAITFLYYLVIGGHFYARDILRYISARSARSSSISFAADQPAYSFIPGELKAFMAETADADRGSIISGMNYILRRYDIDDTSRDSINTYIKNHCSAHLSDEEIQRIWVR